MAAGIADVARAAGVSTATVSRALRGLPNVTEATRERVRAVAEALGYVASPSAASLASGRTRTIGLISPWINRWFFANVIEGAERELRRHGFDVLLYTFDARRRTARPRVDPDVLRRRVDGVLVVGMPLADDEVVALQSLEVPMVCVGWGRPADVTVRLDDHGTATTAVRHLLDLGHRRIAHVTGSADDVAPESPPVRRAQGWRDALVEAGAVTGGDLDALLVRADFRIAGARAAVLPLLTERATGQGAGADVTAVLAASDEMAMGVVLAARDVGLAVPQDLSVMGIDGHDLGELVGLTTMAQPAAEQGATAARMVLDMSADVPVPRETIVATVLVRRTSTAPPSARRRPGESRP